MTKLPEGLKPPTGVADRTRAVVTGLKRDLTSKAVRVGTIATLAGPLMAAACQPAVQYEYNSMPERTRIARQMERSEGPLSGVKLPSGEITWTDFGDTTQQDFLAQNFVDELHEVDPFNDISPSPVEHVIAGFGIRWGGNFLIKEGTNLGSPMGRRHEESSSQEFTLPSEYLHYAKYDGRRKTLVVFQAEPGTDLNKRELAKAILFHTFKSLTLTKLLGEEHDQRGEYYRYLRANLQDIQNAPTQGRINYSFNAGRGSLFDVVDPSVYEGVESVPEGARHHLYVKPEALPPNILLTMYLHPQDFMERVDSLDPEDQVVIQGIANFALQFMRENATSPEMADQLITKYFSPKLLDFLRGPVPTTSPTQE